MRAHQLIELLEKNPCAYVWVNVQTDEESYGHGIDKLEFDNDGDLSLTVFID